MLNLNFLKKASLALLFGAAMISCNKDDDSPTEPTVVSTSLRTRECPFGTCLLTQTLYADSTYNFAGKVYVLPGQTVTIQPGTVLKFDDGSLALSSAFVVAPGAKVNAVGTESAPIIFTSTEDPISWNGTTHINNADLNEAGLWGGLVILGKGIINESTGSDIIEGFDENDQTALAYATYGGSDNADNSGTYEYISIRYTGIPLAPDNEVQGLTLGGVGSGTTFENIEVFRSDDDGVEIFGGAPRLKNLILAYANDDSFDGDEGNKALAQHVLILADHTDGDNAFEWDSYDGTSNTGLSFLSEPIVANATVIGWINPDPDLRDGDRAGDFKVGTGGYIYNSIFANWHVGMNLENDANSETPTDTDAGYAYEQGRLKVEGNVLYNVGTSSSTWSTYITNNNAVLESDPFTTSEVIPSTTVGFGEVVEVGNSWFETTTYKGAFDPAVAPGSTWISNWSLTSTIVE